MNRTEYELWEREYDGADPAATDDVTSVDTTEHESWLNDREEDLDPSLNFQENEAQLRAEAYQRDPVAAMEEEMRMVVSRSGSIPT